MGKKIKIIDIRPFCLWESLTGQETQVGIANGYFAGAKFAQTEGNEFIDEVMGSKFGWIDNEGQRYVENKYRMSRPSEEQILNALEKYPTLRKIAIDQGIVAEYDQCLQFTGPHPDRVWMN